MEQSVKRLNNIYPSSLSIKDGQLKYFNGFYLKMITSNFILKLN